MLILYTTEDGKSRIQLRASEQTVWLTQREMSELFDVSTDNVGLHLKNIFADEELSCEATTEESSVVQMEGAREVRRPVHFDEMLERILDFPSFHHKKNENFFLPPYTKLTHAPERWRHQITLTILDQN